LNANIVDRIYKKLSQSRDNVESELNFRNNFELLISVILSAQATDKSVNAATIKLFVKYPTPEKMLLGGEARLLSLIKTIGLAPTKAKNIIRTCRILLDEFNGEIPGNRESLEKLPGVGRKTASVVLNEGFGQPTIAVDTHVFRVANRTGMAPGKSVMETESLLLEVTPKKWKKMAHSYLILHGRYVCKAKKFDCCQCVIRKECEYDEKSL
jgi:endonuclease-3